jgi:hypothetical protein
VMEQQDYLRKVGALKIQCMHGHDHETDDSRICVLVEGSKTTVNQKHSKQKRSSDAPKKQRPEAQIMEKREDNSFYCIVPGCTVSKGFKSAVEILINHYRTIHERELLPETTFYERRAAGQWYW